MRFVPFLVSLFFFILVNNYFGLVPFIQFPTVSRFGVAVALAIIAWLVYNAVGIQKHGLGGYLKHQTVPSGVGGPVLVLLIPLEFMSNILVRPVTLALRLFANLFAGHILLLLFALGGEYLIAEMGGLYIGAGYGPGPRDGLMTGLAARGWSLRWSRLGIELGVLAVGFALGGTVGVGTVVYALTVGPLVQPFLTVFTVRAPRPADRAGSLPTPSGDPS